MNTLRHAKWMAERGHVVNLFCVAGTPLHKEGQMCDIGMFTVKRNKKNFDFKSAYKLSKTLKELKTEIIWFRDKRDLATIGLSKSFCNGKLKVLYQQAMQIGVVKTHLLHTLRFKKIDAWVTPLHYMADQVKNKTRFDHSKIHIVPLAIDVEDFNKKAYGKTEARQKFNLEENDLVVGIIGRIDPHKAQQFVKDTVVELQKTYPEMKLLIVGNKTEGEWQEYYDTLRDDIELNHQNKSVQMFPFMGDVKSFYNAIDIFVMASAKETFGMVTIEAMMAGKIIAGTNTCGTLELLNNEEFGYYFVPNDIKTLKEALGKILSNRSEAEKKAIAAQCYAKGNFTKEIECHKIEEILESLTK